MKKVAWKSIIFSIEKQWKVIQEPTEQQMRKFFELEKPQQDWLRVTQALFPEIKRMMIELDKHNIVIRNELNDVYVQLHRVLKIIKHVNRRK